MLVLPAIEAVASGARTRRPMRQRNARGLQMGARQLLVNRYAGYESPCIDATPEPNRFPLRRKML